MQKIIINRDINRDGKWVHLNIKMPLVTTGDTVVTEKILQHKEKIISCEYQFGSLVVDVAGPIKSGSYSELLVKVYTSRGLNKILSKAVKEFDDVKRKDFMRYNHFRLSWLGMVLNDDQPCSHTAFPCDVGANTVEEAVINTKAIMKTTVDTGPINEALALSVTAAGATAVGAVAWYGGAYAIDSILDKATVKVAEDMIERYAKNATYWQSQVTAAKLTEDSAKAALDSAQLAFNVAKNEYSAVEELADQARKSATGITRELTSKVWDAEHVANDAKLAFKYAELDLERATEEVTRLAGEQAHAEKMVEDGTRALAKGWTGDYVFGSSAEVAACASAVLTIVPILIAAGMLAHKICLTAKEKALNRIIDNCFLLTTRPNTLQYVTDNGVNGIVAWRELASIATAVGASSLIDLEDKIKGVL